MPNYVPTMGEDGTVNSCLVETLSKYWKKLLEYRKTVESIYLAHIRQVGEVNVLQGFLGDMLARTLPHHYLWLEKLNI